MPKRKQSETGAAISRSRRDWHCVWRGRSGQCELAGSVDGYCAWHVETLRYGVHTDTYDEFALWREKQLRSYHDLRWAIYSAKDYWRLLNGEEMPPPAPLCVSCRKECRSNADFSTACGIAPPPSEAIHEAGTVSCNACGPHPEHVRRRQDLLAAKTKAKAKKTKESKHEREHDHDAEGGSRAAPGRVPEGAAPASG